MEVPDPWIGYVYFDRDVESKLLEKHCLTPDQVRRAICWGAHDQAVWEDHPIYGIRLVVTGDSVETGPVIAYLRPLDEPDGTWEGLTAWRLD